MPAKGSISVKNSVTPSSGGANEGNRIPLRKSCAGQWVIRCEETSTICLPRGVSGIRKLISASLSHVFGRRSQRHALRTWPACLASAQPLWRQ